MPTSPYNNAPTARFLIVGGVVLGACFLLLPLAALLFASDSTLPEGVLGGSFMRSIWVALLSTIMVCVVGTPLAWWLANMGSRWRIALRALVTLPLVLPPVVSGVALLGVFGRAGLLGLDLGFSHAALLIAAAYVAFPFYVLAAESAFRGRDRELEEVAATLGASPWRIFSRIVLPSARPVLLAGVVLTFARAIGEFGATVTFAGSSSRRRTLPLEIFYQIEARGDFAASIALAQVMLLVMLVLVLLLATAESRGHQGRKR